jgi:predicted enzyme related to lactoylglutathione lyase
MSDTPGQFVWYDLMTSDLDRAVAFYTEAVGWGTQPWNGPAPYVMWTVNGAPIGGVVPYTSEHAAAGVTPHWVAYVTVADVDEAVAKTRRHGGTIVNEPRDIPDIGRIAVIRDPQGALIALFKPIAAMPTDESAVGNFSWRELVTSDHEAAFEFYTDLFGWEKTSDFDMGPAMGKYQMYGQDGKAYGGMMNNASVPPHWLCYIKVGEIKAAADRIKQLGGQVLYDPMEVPGGDWVTACLDPQGAAFAIHGVK